MTTVPTAWSVNQLAATTITRHAASGGNCQQLLEMCGLIPEGLETVRRSDVLPDDTREYDTAVNNPDGGSTIGWRKPAPEPPPRHCTTPAGLKTLQGAA